MIWPQMFTAGSVPPGQQAWTSAGFYSFVVPDGVYSIAAVVIGGGGGGATAQSGDASARGGGGGGGLAYHNAIPTTPGEILTVRVGAGATARSSQNSDGSDGNDSFIQRGSTTLIYGKGGEGGKWLLEGGKGGTAGGIAGTVAYSGGKGGDSSSGSSTNGGGSGRYTSAGANSTGFNNCASLYGANTGTNIGYGGSGRKAPPGGGGSTGGVRIMWGEGREFPGNAADV